MPKRHNGLVHPQAQNDAEILGKLAVVRRGRGGQEGRRGIGCSALTGSQLWQGLEAVARLYKMASKEKAAAGRHVAAAISWSILQREKS